MSKLTDKITNPEAIKLLNNIQSGAFFVPAKAWFVRYKWYIVSAFVVLFLLVAISIGRSLYSRAQQPTFLPPDIGTPRPTATETVISDYEWIREDIINFTPELPDPVIPPFDNVINLEGVNI